MSAMAHWPFWATVLVIVATPGTGAIYTLAAGLSHGARAGILAAFASTLGIVPHLLAASLGLAAVLHASALAFDLLKYAGVAYLLFMAWQMAMDRGALRIVADAPRRSPLRVLRDGLALNLFNPKLSIFFVAFLPQFVSSDPSQGFADMIALSLAFMAATFVVFALYGVFAGAFRGYALERPRILAFLRKSFAFAFAGLAARLAVSQR